MARGHLQLDSVGIGPDEVFVLFRVFIRWFHELSGEETSDLSYDTVVDMSAESLGSEKPVSDPVIALAARAARDLVHIIAPAQLDRVVSACGAASPADLPRALQQQIVAYLQRADRNNFVVTNSELVSDGVGVFPLGALLNHSCAPNLCVAYAPGTHRQCFRALRAIRAGDELCHSYTDMCKPTPLRRAALQTQFGFDCACVRCSADGAVDAALTALGTAAAAAARMAFAAAAYDRATRGQLRLAAHHDPALATAAAAEVVVLLDSAPDTPDTPASLHLLQAAAAAAAGAAGPHHWQALAVRTALQRALLALRRHDAALPVSQQIRSTYEAVYGPVHPAVGVQLAVEGQLLAATGQRAAGRAVLQQACGVLQCTQGDDSPLLADLRTMLVQLADP
jgi:hypothetical protein